MGEIDNLKRALETCKLESFVKKTKSDWIPSDYKEVVEESLLNISFKPDIFQKQAFYLLAQNNSVFVTAHTSSGKTLVAEYAIALSIKNNSRVIYTSPIKALSNQKFYDFKQKFPDIGIITGDVQVNPTAKCLIMTTEILRNLVYKNSDILRDTEFVIFDEVHYINDADRGVVWEECIIMLPKHINLVMLSATIPNAIEFAEWVGRTKERCVYVISTFSRAVPLEFAIYCDSEAFSVEDKPSKTGEAAPTNFRAPLTPYSKKMKIVNKNKINDLGNFVNNRRLVPAIFFAFSKRVCEEHGKSLQLLDLTTPMEKKTIAKFLDDAMSNLREEDRNLPQIRTMREQVYCGIAVHHGGLLPFVKECVEMLFSENLIKILVATETFAMGVNMPAKCCAFLNLTKIENGTFRLLHTGEFIQMSGRAGRRGMDKVGTVLIADPKTSSIDAIKKVISGIPKDLSSQFKLSFSLILMAFRSNVEVQDLMRKSFREHGAQKNMNEDAKKLVQLESMRTLECDDCKEYKEFLGDLIQFIKEIRLFVRKSLKPEVLAINDKNKLVKIVSVNKNTVFYESTDCKIEGTMFQHPVNAAQAVNAKDLFRYPPTCIDKEGGQLKESCAIDEIILLVKDNKISFDFNETDVYNLCRIEELKKLFNKISNSICLRCKDFSVHYSKAVESKRIIDQINTIKSKYSVEALIQIDEYTARLKFLEQHSFLNNGMITLKGRAASEIRTVNDVVMADLIFHNELEQLSISKIISVFSCMITEEEVEETEEDNELEKEFGVVQGYYDSMSENLQKLGIPAFDVLRKGMMRPVYAWCLGESLGAIVAKYNVQEGTFVRLLLRLDEFCREMMNVTELIGNSELFEKFSEGSVLIKRDIVFMKSLYI